MKIWWENSKGKRVYLDIKDQSKNEAKQSNAQKVYNATRRS
jgi:hypothetical protein